MGFIALALADGGGFDIGALLESLMGGKSHGGGFVKTHASIEESPEIGIGIHKIPIMLPMPTIILRKSKHLVAKGMTMPVGCGGGGGGCGGGGGGGYMMGGGGGGGTLVSERESAWVQFFS